jgi:putative transposase
VPRRRYPSDLSDAEWAVLAPLLPTARPGGRPRKHPTRELVDAMLYVLRGGIAWRALPHEFPPWQSVYHYFRAWRRDGTWERLNDTLRKRERVRQGRAAQPTGAVLDSQSAKTTEKGGLAAGTGPSA